MKIMVSDIPALLEFLGSTGKFVPGCQFVVTPEKMLVRAISENRKIRMFMETNAARGVTPDEITFSYADISRLVKVFHLVHSIEKTNVMEFDYDGMFLSYENLAKFKLLTVKNEHSEKIDKYITTPVKTEIVPLFSFKTSSDRIKLVLQQTGMITSNDAKVYIIRKNNMMVCELEDKTNPASDCIGIPISVEMTGSIDRIIILTYETFKTFNIISSDDIVVNYCTDASGQGFVDVQSRHVNDKTYINTRILSHLAK
jgi:hypothetical protein